MKTKLLLILIALVTGLTSFARQTSGNDAWTLAKTENNVSVYYEQSTCSNNNVVVVRIVNNNSTAANVSWTLWEGGQAKTMEVKANETITGTCENRPRVFMLTEMIPAGKTIKDIHANIQINVQR